jgi:hypothetical protein
MYAHFKTDKPNKIEAFFDSRSDVVEFADGLNFLSGFILKMRADGADDYTRSPVSYEFAAWRRKGIVAKLEHRAERERQRGLEPNAQMFDVMANRLSTIVVIDPVIEQEAPVATPITSPEDQTTIPPPSTSSSS